MLQIQIHLWIHPAVKITMIIFTEWEKNPYSYESSGTSNKQNNLEQSRKLEAPHIRLQDAMKPQPQDRLGG